MNILSDFTTHWGDECEADGLRDYLYARVDLLEQASSQEDGQSRGSIYLSGRGRGLAQERMSKSHPPHHIFKSQKNLESDLGEKNVLPRPVRGLGG